MVNRTRKEKLTIANLIAKKEEIQARKLKTAEIETEIGIIRITAPSRALALEAAELGQDGGDEYLIYHCIKEPCLKDAKLQEAYGCIEPMDIVGQLFCPGEITAIALEIMRLAGYNNGTISLVRQTDEVIKN